MIIAIVSKFLQKYSIKNTKTQPHMYNNSNDNRNTNINAVKIKDGELQKIKNIKKIIYN